MKRRDFVKRTGTGLAAGVALGAGAYAPAQAGGPEATRTSGRPSVRADVRVQKAVKFHMVEEEGSTLDKFRLLKTLGFDGVEMSSPNELDQEEVIEAARTSGLPIHGVVDSVHWEMPLSASEPDVRAAGLAGLEAALTDAKAYGATTVLLVPAVVKADVPYDAAYQRSQEEIRKVLPLAEELGVKIALENVWNQFLLSPLEFARYIDAFESEWIGAYFDVGNVVNFGWPEHWIHILGDRILKLDIKEYSRSKRDEEGPYAGFRVELGEGDVDWDAVVAALADIGYSGWATAEIPGGDAERLREIARRMDQILPT